MCGKFFHYVSDHQLLRQNSTPQRQLATEHLSVQQFNTFSSADTITRKWNITDANWNNFCIGEILTATNMKMAVFRHVIC